MSCGAVAWRIIEGRLQLLLIKQFEHKDSWGIPKGHIHKNESTEECAIRETREETGVAVKLGVRLPDCITYFKNESKTVVSYLATPVGNHEPIHDDPDNEVADAKWLDVDNLPKIHNYQQQLIATVIELLRAHVKSEETQNLSDEPKSH